MGISDMIADFIGEMIKESDGETELQRADIATKFGCVPSQINYVISTRFSPEHGYIVESRRGGNGYIRIRRIQTSPRDLIMSTINAIGNELDLRTAEAYLSNLKAVGAIDSNSEKLISSAIGESALRPVEKTGRDIVRASIIKQMLINL